MRYPDLDWAIVLSQPQLSGDERSRPWTSSYSEVTKDHLIVELSLPIAQEIPKLHPPPIESLFLSSPKLAAAPSLVNLKPWKEISEIQKNKSGTSLRSILVWSRMPAKTRFRTCLGIWIYSSFDTSLTVSGLPVHRIDRAWERLSSSCLHLFPCCQG